MTEDFDPYLHWLGIRDPVRPPNHYRLLGIEQFESDPDVIAMAADRQMAHVRTFQSGKRSNLSQQLLNELAAAKICLLNEQKKADYDGLIRPNVDDRNADEAYSSEEANQNPFEIHTSEPPLRLNRPKRGRRGWLSRIIMTLAVLLLVSVPAAIYFQLYWRVLRTSVVPDRLPTTEPQEVPESGDLSATTKNESPNDARVDSTADTTQRLQPDTSSPKPQKEDSAVEIAPWDIPVSPSWQPLSFTATNPLGAFVLALANRDVASARPQLDTSVRSNSTLSPVEADALELFLWSHEQFWISLDKAVADLRLSETVDYHGATMTLVSRDSDTLVFQAKNKTRKSFSVDRNQIDSELAITLVQSTGQLSQPTAWRLAGCFLSVDKQGDTRLADEFLTRAERNGAAARPIREAIQVILRETSSTGDGNFFITPD